MRASAHEILEICVNLDDKPSRKAKSPYPEYLDRGNGSRQT
jgi:hypothetical protein